MISTTVSPSSSHSSLSDMSDFRRDPSKPDLKMLSFEELKERFIQADEDEREKILLAYIENPLCYPNEFEDESLFYGLINTLIKKAFSNCGFPIPDLRLLGFSSLEECQIGSEWLQDMTIAELDENLKDTSTDDLDNLARLFNNLLFHLSKNENFKEKDLQHYCSICGVIAKHGLSNEGNVDLEEFEGMVKWLTVCAGKGNVREQWTLPPASKVFQEILEKLLIVVASCPFRGYLKQEVEIRIREALFYANIFPNPAEARVHLIYLVTLLERKDEKYTNDENLARKIFYFSPDLQISARAAQLFCYNHNAIEIIKRLAGLEQTCLQDGDTDLELLEIAALMSKHMQSMEQIPWSSQHSWWNTLENLIPKDQQKNYLKIIRQILASKGSQQPKLVWGTARFCLASFFSFSLETLNDPECLKKVQMRLQGEKDDPKFAFLQALAPVFFQEAANIICSDGKLCGTYGDALRCICLAGGLEDGPEAFEFIHSLIKLLEQKALGKLYFELFRVFEIGNVILPKDFARAMGCLEKSCEYQYQPATQLALPTTQVFQQQCVQAACDYPRVERRPGTCVHHLNFGIGWTDNEPDEIGNVIVTFDPLASCLSVPKNVLKVIPNNWEVETNKPEENMATLFCSEMEKGLAPLKDRNEYDRSEIVESMAALFLQANSEIDWLHVRAYIDRSEAKSLFLIRSTGQNDPQENFPVDTYYQSLKRIINGCFKSDAYALGQGIFRLRKLARGKGNCQTTTERAKAFLNHNCNAIFKQASRLFNSCATAVEARAALDCALAACVGGLEGNHANINRIFRAMVNVINKIKPESLGDDHYYLAKAYRKIKSQSGRDLFPWLHFSEEKATYHFSEAAKLGHLKAQHALEQSIRGV